MTNNSKLSYRNVLKDDDQLKLFMLNLGKFDSLFSDSMDRGVDFTLRLEVRGQAGRLVHCRVYNDSYDRPQGVDPSQKMISG